MARHIQLDRFVFTYSAFFGLAAAVVVSVSGNLASAQIINPAYSDQLTISRLTRSDPDGIVSNLGNVSQMVMHPNGRQVFVASYLYGIVRFDYGTNEFGLPTMTNATEIWRDDPPGDQNVRGSIGLAFRQIPSWGRSCISMKRCQTLVDMILR